MDYTILPFKTAKFLRLLRKAQIDQSHMLCIMAASRSIVFRSFFVSILFTSLRCSASSDTGVCVYIHIIQPPVELVNTFLRKFCDFLC